MLARADRVALPRRRLLGHPTWMGETLVRAAHQPRSASESLQRGSSQRQRPGNTRPRRAPC